MGLRVAVVGATGLVGRTILHVLEEGELPVTEIVALASERSAGTRLKFMGDDIEVKRLQPASFAACDVVFFAAGATVSREFVPLAAQTAALVVDNSAAFRLDAGVPLIVPEVNGHILRGKPGVETSCVPAHAGQDDSSVAYHRIVANPNCSTIQMVVALNPLHRAFGLESVIVSTYQSVSGSGAKGVRALEYELQAEHADPDSPYPHPIAFNALPHIDVLDEEGWSGEERKMMAETRKILDLPHLQVIPTAVRVPVRIGHSEAIYARFERPISPDRARTTLAEAPGVVVEDEPPSSRYPQAITAQGRDDVFVGRIRQEQGDDQALALWVVSDNLRKGAATNAIQIAVAALNNVERQEKYA